MNDQAEEIKISCPHCGQHYAVEATMLGTSIECQQCGTEFVIEKPPSASVHAPSAVDEPKSEISSGSVDELKVEADSVAKTTSTDEYVPKEGLASTAAPASVEEPSAEPEPEASSGEIQKSSFANRVKHAFEQASKRIGPVLAQVAKWSKKGARHLAKCFGAGMKQVAHHSACLRRWYSALPKRNRLIVVSVAASIVVLFGLFMLMRGDSGIGLSVEEITRGKNACELVEKGKGFRTNGRGLMSYVLPLGMRSDRISFDIRVHESDETKSDDYAGLFTGEGMWADSIGIPWRGMQLKEDRWIHVDVRLRKTDAIVSIAGKTKKIPRPAGVRFTMLTFGNGSDFSVRNIRVYPSRRHLEAVKTYEDAIALAGKSNLGRKIKLIEQAAELGLAEAQCSFALFGQLGWGGVALAPREQEKWLRQAAEQGDPDGQEMLGKVYFHGTGFALKNEREALKWLRAASAAGDVSAMLECADLLLHGKEIDHNAKEAQTLLEKCTIAILFGDSQAEKLDQAEKGRAYFLYALTLITGEDGAEKDRSKGIEQLRMAAQYGDPEAIKVLQSL